MYKKKANFENQEDVDVKNWNFEGNRWMYLACVKLLKEGNPLLYWETSSGKPKLTVDVDHEKYDHDKLFITILLTAREIKNAWDRNYERNEVKE